MGHPAAHREAIRVLESISTFAGVEPETLEGLARAAVCRPYEAGEIVFLEGDVCAGLYVVERGWLKSYKIDADGREQVIRLVGPGESFNEIGVLAGSRNLVTVAILEPSLIWVLRRESVLNYVEHDHRFALSVTQNLAQRVLHLMAMVEDLSLRSVEERLVQLLLLHAVDRRVRRRRWATQAEMASRLGTVPEVIGRTLRKLADEGLIRVERHEIEILDPTALEAQVLSGR